jgi:hypothetical protein
LYFKADLNSELSTSSQYFIPYRLFQHGYELAHYFRSSRNKVSNLLLIELLAFFYSKLLKITKFYIVYYLLTVCFLTYPATTYSLQSDSLDSELTSISGKTQPGDIPAVTVKMPYATGNANVEGRPA